MTVTDLIAKEGMEFEETKFAKGGGSAFECSDYEGMYADLKSFLHASNIRIAKAVMERLVALAEVKKINLSGKVAADDFVSTIALNEVKKHEWSYNQSLSDLQSAIQEEMDKLKEKS